MNGAQTSAFQVNSGIAPSAMTTVLVDVVFVVLLVWGVWGVWAIRTAYVGWSESHLNQRQFSQQSWVIEVVRLARLDGAFAALSATVRSNASS